MKNIILNFLSFILMTSTLGAVNNPVKGNFLINSDAVEVYLVSESESALFTKALFNEKEENLEFTTTEVVTYIQIFDSKGKLEFQLPVQSKDISIGKSLFGEGDYKLGFIVIGKDEIQFTDVRFN